MADDPEIVSDVLFAIANVITFARTTYFMPAFEILGPLQISFTRMLTDITRFMVLFLLVLFAFMVGLYNLFWYYGSRVIKIYNKETNETKEVPTTEVFEGLKHTLYTLFWSMFGQISLSSVPIKHPPEYHLDSNRSDKEMSSTAIVEGVGLVLLGTYHVIIIIVLVNMLIAMMSHSFEDIQKDCDVEWKFARTKLWVHYIDNGSTLPAPFNLIPTRNTCINALRFLKSFSESEPNFLSTNSRSTDFIRTRRKRVCLDLEIIFLETSYKDIMQRLVRRYLFKMERERDFDDAAVVRGDESHAGQNTENIIVFGADNSDTHSREDGGSSNLSHNPSLTRKSTSTKRGITMGTVSSQQHRPSITLPSGGSVRQSIAQQSYSQTQHLPPPPPGPPPPKLQMITLPQLDSIQRTQKILDMRLQTLQAQSDQLNLAAGNSRIKEEIVHVRSIMGESQKALRSIITGISQVQEQMCGLNKGLEQLVMTQATPVYSNNGNQKRTSNESSSMLREPAQSSRISKEDISNNSRSAH